MIWLHYFQHHVHRVKNVSSFHILYSHVQCMYIVPVIHCFNHLTPRSNFYSPFCQPYNSYHVILENLSIESTNYPQIEIFLNSHHLSVWYCIDNVRRNSVFVTHGSSRDNDHIRKFWWVEKNCIEKINPLTNKT